MTGSPLDRLLTGPGVIAALDHNPDMVDGALERHGVDTADLSTDELLTLSEGLQKRVITSSAFDGDRVLGAIFYERSLDRIEVDGVPVVEYLWRTKGIVSILTVGVPLIVESGAELMAPIEGLEASLEHGARAGVVGTKSRNVIHAADRGTINRLADQQFEVARAVMAHGLVPIMEPEASLSMTEVERDEAEAVLLEALSERLTALDADARVAFKLTVPVAPGRYGALLDDPRVTRVVALSGGFDQAAACERLALNPGMGSSFSRAFLEGLRVDQSDDELAGILNDNITAIAAASR